ncbi:MAG: flagellar hook-basal body complex protein FliE [Candidatus Marinimicrobia bacterium]|nr:flagellar hook-basal body complex protein FliE [Candidatus Neomarinimicrobiota bacterium]
MSKIAELSQINQLVGLENNQLKKVGNDQNNTSAISFGDTIKDFLTTVNDSQKDASEKVSDVIQGKSENLAEAMTSLEEASLNFQLMLEIRNKLIESFNEIKRMPV